MNEAMPTLREELDRKTLEAMESLVSQHQQGKIAPAELHTGLEAIWNTTAGLITPDITHMLAAMLDHIKQGIVVKRLFVNAKGEPVLLEHDLNNAVVRIKSQLTYFDGWKKNHTLSFENEVNPSAAAKRRFDVYIEGLKGKGYTEVA